MSSALVAAQRVSIQHVATVDPAQLLQALLERRDAGLKFRIVRGCGHQHADVPYTLLRARRERPGRRRTTQNAKKGPSPHVSL